jgi:hypothetical protein
MLGALQAPCKSIAEDAIHWVPFAFRKLQQEIRRSHQIWIIGAGAEKRHMAAETVRSYDNVKNSLLQMEDIA